MLPFWMCGCCAAATVASATASPSPVPTDLRGVVIMRLLSVQEFHHVLHDGRILRAHHRKLRDDFLLHCRVLLFARQIEEACGIPLHEEAVDYRLADLGILVGVVDFN